MIRLAAVASAVTLGLVSLVACSSDGRTLRPAGPNQTLSIITTTTAASTTTAAARPASGFVVTAPWADGGFIGAQYTCKGADTSPAISWTGVPASAQELAISLVDLDADNFVHWVVAGLDPASTGIAAGRVPAGAIQAANGFGESKYGGPCPPDGQHKYLLTLYALGARSNLADGVAAATAIELLQSSSVASALVTGSFGVVRAIRAAAFTDLDVVTLYRLLALRVAVFVVEQECAYLELDGRDVEAATVHLWIDDDRDGPVAYLRILTDADGTIRIGRVVTAPARRGEGHAAALVGHALAITAPATAVLDAQSHLTGWYEELGFEVAGPEYLDDGIPHTPMRLVRSPC